MRNILILDGNQRSALAATRSLGKRGIPVTVADELRETLSGASRYCSETFVYPSPYICPEDFIQLLRKECIKRKIEAIFPMTEVTTYLLSRYREKLSSVSIPFAPFQSFDLLTDKWRLNKLARELEIPVPITYCVRRPEEILSLSSKLTFPLVLKPYRSRILSEGKWISTSVQYACSPEELEEKITRNPCLRTHPFLLQEYIKGEGRGVFTLYNQGEPVTFFAHRRLREKPPSGGVSVLSESVEMNPVLREMAQRILDHVKWHGVAMVEFKVTSNGTPYLIEINARFWGSLQLAIDAGVDFPYLLYTLAIGERVENVNSYQVGIKNRWLLGDLDHLYLTFKNHPPYYLAPFSEWKAIIQFLNFFQTNTRYEVGRWDDLKPFLFELKQYLRN